MAQKSRKHGKSGILERCIRSTNMDALKDKSINDAGIPPFHFLSKKDIEKELSLIEKKFGMSPDDFHKAWKEGKVHGHEAMKLGCYYEFYKDEYE